MARTQALTRLLKAFLRPLLRLLPDRVVARAVCERTPRSGILEVTSACNLECPLCPTHYLPRKTRFLDRAVFRDFLRATSGRLKAVCFHLQGEPMVHPELFDFVEECTRQGVDTSFGTNGMLLEQYSDRIFESGLTEISIDIDGADAKDYARYRKRGDFDRVVSGVERLVEEKKRRKSEHPTIHVQTIMFSYNEDREPEIDSLHERLGADRSRKKRPSYFHDIELGKQRGLKIRPDIQHRADDAAEQFLADVDHKNPNRRWARQTPSNGQPFKERRLCPQLRRATVLADGRVVACCMDALGMTEFGNVNERPFEEIWRSERHQKVVEDFLARKLVVCETCTLS